MSKFSLSALIAKHKAGKNKPTATSEELENLADLKADLLATTASLEEALASHEAIEADFAACQGDLATAQASLTAAQATHTQALADLEASVATRADARALDLIAAQGVPSASLPAADAKEPKVKTVTRAEFEALDENAKAAHFRAGGKITE